MAGACTSGGGDTLMAVASPYRILAKVEQPPAPKREPCRLPEWIKTGLVLVIANAAAFWATRRPARATESGPELDPIEVRICVTGARESCQQGGCNFVAAGVRWPGVRRCSDDGTRWSACDCQGCDGEGIVRSGAGAYGCNGACDGLRAPCLALDRESRNRALARPQPLGPFTRPCTRE